MWVYIWNDTWLPNENTLAYFPFKDDILDKKWNYTLSNNWNSKDTIWYKFTSYALINISDNVTPKTTSMWAKPISIGNNTYSDTQMATLPNFTGYYLHHKNSSLNQKYVTFTNSSYASVTASASVSFNQRYLFTTVYDGSFSKTLLSSFLNNLVVSIVNIKISAFTIHFFEFDINSLLELFLTFKYNYDDDISRKYNKRIRTYFILKTTIPSLRIDILKLINLSKKK